MIELPKFSFGLGTVQIGLPYGNQIFNNLMSEKQAFEILHEAASNEMLFWDTAPAYGLSEERIGAFMRAYSFFNQSVLISTKLPRAESYIWQNKTKLYEFFKKSLNESLQKLNATKLSLIFLHQSDLEFISSSYTRDVLDQLRSEDYFDQIGVSVYTLEEAFAAIENLGTNWLQVPVSLVDRRFLDPFFVAQCQVSNVALVARSILLQGVLTQHGSIPPVKSAEKLFSLRSKLLAIIGESSITLDELSIQFISKIASHNLKVALIGADTVNSLRTNISSIKLDADDILRRLEPEFKEFAQSSFVTSIVDPRNWNS